MSDDQELKELREKLNIQSALLLARDEYISDLLSSHLDILGKEKVASNLALMVPALQESQAQLQEDLAAARSNRDAFEEQNTQLLKERAELRAQRQQLMEEVAALKAPPPPKRRGRPKKESLNGKHPQA